MDFILSGADPCIWLRNNPKLDLHGYIAIYVDDLCLAAEMPEELISIFKTKYEVKVKEVGKLTFHTGADYFHDPDGNMVSQPQKYFWKLKNIHLPFQ